MAGPIEQRRAPASRSASAAGAPALASRGLRLLDRSARPPTHEARTVLLEVNVMKSAASMRSTGTASSSAGSVS